ncbi:MAG: type II CRISPR-associated endonuclease Cas1 [Rhodospirillales bacterium]|nr:type II CRISPR-associated endonuclease Cas1 [Rhodospirillales bacterium]
MLRKTVEIATPGTRLSVAHRQLVIERPDQPRATLPIEDLGVVVVDDARATYTQAVFIELLAAGATVMVTGRDHLPVGMMLPLDAHHVQTERHRAQVDAGRPLKKRLWQALVRAKIALQGDVLRTFGGEDGGLGCMARRVRSGDPDNLEAQAAQRYWPRLFGPDFRRDRTAEGINALLNYGYAVVRAATARAVVASGLIPSLGVFHKNRGNPFCLADDLLEPYRPFVDWRVRLLCDESGTEVPSLDHRPNRAALLSLFNETVVVEGRRLPFLLAIQTGAVSLCRALVGEGKTLALPEGLPIGIASDEDKEAD